MPRLVRVDAEDAASATVAYDEVRADGDAVWWLESQPERGGRVVLTRFAYDSGARPFTPAGVTIGTDLHGYGGGAYAIGDDRVWFVDGSEGHVCVLDRQGARVVVERRDPSEHLGDLFAEDGRLWCVRETPAGDELLHVAAGGEHQVVVRTSAFLGSPRPVSGSLAWLRWDTDRMPWDGTELMVARRRGEELEVPYRVGGGREESVTQPYWDDRGHLWFVSDRTGWWNLYRFDGHRSVSALPMAADAAPPEWEAGYRSHLPIDSRTTVVIEHGPQQRLLVNDESGVRALDTRYTSFKPYLAAHQRRLLAIAASPVEAPQVVAIDLNAPNPTTVLARPQRKPGAVSQPQTMKVHGVGTPPVTALLYPPAGASHGWCAPLVVRAHPGPTASIQCRLDWHVQYLTSHGFAVADVDYRGSSGYGRAFRRSLYGAWGNADVQDCIAVAQQLLDEGRTRPGQVFITGASAGGFTALQAVSMPSVFAGAVARSAIIDPGRWQHAAPRWQRAHAAALAAPAGRVRAEAIDRPVLLIHGADDHVAPLDDARELANTMRDRGRRCQLVILNARHQASASQAVAQALEAELRFYRELVDS